MLYLNLIRKGCYIWTGILKEIQWEEERYLSVEHAEVGKVASQVKRYFHGQCCVSQMLAACHQMYLPNQEGVKTVFKNNIKDGQGVDILYKLLEEFRRQGRYAKHITLTHESTNYLQEGCYLRYEKVDEGIFYLPPPIILKVLCESAPFLNLCVAVYLILAPGAC